jgi:signal transduction histidine kinase
MTTTIVTGLVLLFLNLYCAQFSQELFYQSKQLAMVDKAMLTAEEMGNADVLTAETASEIIDRLGGPDTTRLIVTDTAGRILYDSTGAVDAQSYALFPQIISALKGNDIFTWHYQQGVIRAETAIPIVSYNSISGCLYMMDRDTDQGRFIQTLQGGILIISVLLELFLIGFSLTSAQRFSSRLRNIMISMRIIQDGNYSHKVTLDGHDELTILGEEFNDLTDRLHQSEEQRRQFVSDASHELKTPLASIKLLTDSILQ